MIDSKICLNARALLREVEPLKKQFNLTYDAAKRINDLESRTELRQLLALVTNKINALQEKVWIAEADRILRPQYESQIDHLYEMGILQASEDVTEPWFIGVDKQRCILPSYKQILLHILEKREVYREKFDQGFTKLLFTPFGLDVMDLFEGLRKYLQRYKEEESDTSELKMPGALQIHTSVYAFGGTSETRVVHFSEAYSRADHSGKTKADILKQQREDNIWNAGWRISLVQAGDDGRGIMGLVRKGEEEKRGTLHPREDFQAFGTAADRHADLVTSKNDRSSPYYSEEGWLVEDWVCAFVTNLDETGTLLDGDRNRSLCMGAYRPVTNSVPAIYFLSSEAQKAWGVGVSDVGVAQRLDDEDYIRTCITL